MALVTTPGAADADSYATLAEANTYHSTKRYPALSGWAAATATDAVKEAALRLAAILLDRMFEWNGSAVDSTQARVWPRTGMLTRNGFAIPTSGATSIPTDLKEAQAEFAGQLIQSDRLSDNDAAKKGITSVKAGSVAVTFKDVDVSSAESLDAQLRLMGSELAYLHKTVPDVVRFLLVPSWYRENTIKRPFLFGAM